MKKETIFGSCRKATSAFLAALLLVGGSSVTVDIFANAEEVTEEYAMGCIPDSDEEIEAHLASTEEIYDIEIAGDVTDEATYDALVDVCAAATVSTLPEEVDLTDQFPTPGDQGSQGSCTAWAVGYALKSHQEYVEHTEKGETWNLSSSKCQYSPAYIYNQINRGVDEGSYISDAMNLIGTEGVCSLYNMSYREGNYTNQPNASQEDVASNFKNELLYVGKGGSKSYYSTITGVDEVKAQLKQENGVVISIWVTPDFRNYVTSIENRVFDYIDPEVIQYRIDNPNTYSKKYGYHAICLIGYDDNHVDAQGNVVPSFKFINSWGTSWNGSLNGYGYISYEIFESQYGANNTGYIMSDLSDSDESLFFTSEPSTGYVKATTDIRAYSSPDFYVASTYKDNFSHTISAGTVIKIDSFVSSSNGLQPYFKTSDGYYINAQKSCLEESELEAVNNILINGTTVNAGSTSQSETSTISFATSSIQYNNHNTMKIDYTVNQSDSYNGYAGAQVSGGSTVSTTGATGIGFWYMTPAGTNGTIALCMQGSVTKKIVSLPTTNGEWKYFYSDYSFSGSSMSNVEIYINGSESDCVTSPASGTLYIAELAATNITEAEENTVEYTVTAKTSGSGTVSGAGSYGEGSTVTLTATPDSNYKVVGWLQDGKIVGTDSTYTFTISADTEVTAVFGISDLNYYSLKAYATEGGSVLYSGENFYQAGSSISVTAVADDGYEFIGWSFTENGDVSITGSNYISKITSDLTLYARFAKKVTTYTLTATATEGGYIEGNVNPSEYTPPVTTTTTAQQEQNIPSEDSGTTYVLNTNSKKIHYASCSSVDDMKESNKAFTNDYNQAIADGYKPCGRCKP